MHTEFVQYIPMGGMFIVFIGGLIAMNKDMVKRPTFKEADDRYKEKKVCDVIHKSVEEKLDCIPEIKTTVTQIETKIDILLKNNHR